MGGRVVDAQALAQVALQEVVEEDDVVLLRGVGGSGSERLRLSGKRRSRSDAKVRRSSRRSHGVVTTSMSVKPEPQLLQAGAQPTPRKLLGLLVAIEALLLQDQLGHTVPEESNAAVVRLGYDPENAQGSNTAQLNSVG